MSPPSPSFPLTHFPLVLSIFCQLLLSDHQILGFCKANVFFFFSYFSFMFSVSLLIAMAFKIVDMQLSSTFLSLAQTSLRFRFTNPAAYLTFMLECFTSISNPKGLHRALDFPFSHSLPPVLCISANGPTLHQWLSPKTKESSFMPLFPLPLTSNTSPSSAYFTYINILRLIHFLFLYCYPLGLAISSCT